MHTMEGVLKKKTVPENFLGAFKRGHRFAAREYIDEELAFKLLAKADIGCAEALEALTWLTKFNNEFYKSVFKKDGSDFHATAQDRKALDHSKYARSVDVMVGEIVSIAFVEAMTGSEDALIDLIDLKREREKSRSQ